MPNHDCKKKGHKMHWRDPQCRVCKLEIGLDALFFTAPEHRAKLQEQKERFVERLAAQMYQEAMEMMGAYSSWWAKASDENKEVGRQKARSILEGNGDE